MKNPFFPRNPMKIHQMKIYQMKIYQMKKKKQQKKLRRKMNFFGAFLYTLRDSNPRPTD